MRAAALVILAGCFADPGPQGAPPPPAGPWELVQTAGTTAPQLALMPTQPGDLLVIAAQFGVLTQTFSDSSGTAYQRIAGSLIGCYDGYQLAFYVGRPATSIASVSSAGDVSGWTIWEFHGLAADPIDAAGTVPLGGDTTVPSGPTLTTTAPGELAVSAVIAHGMIQGSHALDEFVNDQIILGNGYAHLASNQVPAGTPLTAHWDQLPNDIYCASGITLLAAP